ncbi:MULTISPECIES: head completion/stabilization protein [Sphingomonadaceae]|uniref:Head completion/stabilization protein n=1 Tax=Novosphingobium clariflavum TaxID=2029884 RepID=A0ABV6S4X4_9SPHN|nr:head completion/stabilization protein [Sphingomonas sp. IC081]QDK34545.1 head completion/stabilization protein [Sphingomonas sp. IC081]
MSFSAGPARPADITVPGDGWYPDFNATAMRDALRLTTMVTPERLLGAVQGGMLSVEGELAEWRGECEAEGAASLADVKPERMVAGEHRLTLLYTRAVRMYAAAELAETHRDLTATQDGQARADTEATTAQEYLRMATHAIRDILGTPRTAVELI